MNSIRNIILTLNHIISFAESLVIFFCNRVLDEFYGKLFDLCWGDKPLEEITFADKPVVNDDFIERVSDLLQAYQ